MQKQKVLANTSQSRLTNKTAAVVDKDWTTDLLQCYSNNGYFIAHLNYIHTDTHTFNDLSSRTTWVSRHQKGKPFWILLKQETMGWQWHQLDHMQINCATLQTDNHANTPSLNFLWAGCSSWHPTNSVKPLKAKHLNYNHYYINKSGLDDVISVPKQDRYGHVMLKEDNDPWFPHTSKCGILLSHYTKVSKAIWACLCGIK